MSEPFIGEIRWFPYIQGAPINWQACDGTLLSVQQNPVLFGLISTTYGGNGSTTFAVPDLRGAVPLHQGSGGGLTPRRLGDSGGQWEVALSIDEMPAHTHFLAASTDTADSTSPTTRVPAATGNGLAFYATNAQAAGLDMNDFMLQPIGNGRGHDNCMPTIALTACIALSGIIPNHG